MSGSSNLIMWLTLVLVVSLVMVLGLLSLLLVELYCPTIIRFRREVNTPNVATTDTVTTTTMASEDDIEKQVPKSPENQKKGSALLYISNPIYNDENGGGTPFETPDSSPSRLGTEEDSSGDDEKDEISLVVVKTKTKKVTNTTCLKDVRLLGTSGSDSTSCSSLTPCTSPSL